MATTLSELVVKLGMDSVNFQNGITSLNRNMRVLKSEMDVAKSSTDSFGNSTDSLKNKSDILNRQLEVQKAKIDNLKSSYDQSVKVKGEDDKATQGLAIQLNKAVAEYNKMESQLKDTNDALDKQSSKFYKIDESLKVLGPKLQEFGGKLQSVGKTLSVAVTAPIVGLGAAAVKSSIDFESAFAGVRKTVDATEEQFSQLNQGIRDMAKEMPPAASEIAGVAEAAGQLGIKTENILGFTKTMVMLGDSTNLSADQAATALARLANITQIPQTEFDRLGSTIVALGEHYCPTTWKQVA